MSRAEAGSEAYPDYEGGSFRKLFELTIQSNSMQYRKSCYHLFFLEICDDGDDLPVELSISPGALASLAG